MFFRYVRWKWLDQDQWNQTEGITNPNSKKKVKWSRKWCLLLRDVVEKMAGEINQKPFIVELHDRDFEEEAFAGIKDDTVQSANTYGIASFRFNDIYTGANEISLMQQVLPVYGEHPTVRRCLPSQRFIDEGVDDAVDAVDVDSKANAVGNEEKGTEEHTDTNIHTDTGEEDLKKLKPIRMNPYGLAQTCMKVKLRVPVPLGPPLPHEFEYKYARAVFIFKYDDDDTLWRLLDTIADLNAAALDMMDQPRTALAIVNLSEEQQSNDSDLVRDGIYHHCLTKVMTDCRPQS